MESSVLSALKARIAEDIEKGCKGPDRPTAGLTARHIRLCAESWFHSTYYPRVSVSLGAEFDED